MKKRYKYLLVILLVLIAGRIYLPYWVVSKVNKTLKEIPGYAGSIDDVDIHLYRGAYSIDNLDILREDSVTTTPFFSSKKIDLSIEWSAIFNGAIVGEIELIEPELNFVTSTDSTKTQYGENVDWTKPIKELIPLQIDKLTVENGGVHFINEDTKPTVDVYIDSLNLTATNLNNSADSKETLPSDLIVTATSLGGGKLNVNGGLNILKEIPDMDLSIEFESVELPALNDFSKVYAGVDAESGQFNMYSEFAIKSGKIEGYVKPIINDLNLISWENDKDEPLLLAWELVAQGFLELFENQPKDQFATKAPFSGDLTKPNTRVFPTIWNVFYNAFFKALSKETDNTIDFSSALEE